MKSVVLKHISIFLAFTILSSQVAFASSFETKMSSDDINFDDISFEAEFEEINELEEAVLSNKLTSIEEAVAFGFNVNHFKSITSTSSTQGFDWDNFDWPAGLWGFLCCPIGFFVIVTNKNKSKDEKTSFWIGVAASTVLSLLTTPFRTTTY